MAEKESKPKAMIGKISVWCSHDALVPTGDLKANPRNPNQHPAEQVQKLADIIRAQGWRWPIKVSLRSGYIVSGHCRLEAAKKAKLKKVPVDYQDYDSDEAETADLLADNKVQELSILDEAAAFELMLELEKSSFDIGLTGFTLEEFEALGGATDTPAFEPGTEDDQGRLDEKAPTVCPECGHSWIK